MNRAIVLAVVLLIGIGIGAAPPAVAQTAQVIALSPADAREAQRLQDAIHLAEANWNSYEQYIDNKYLKLNPKQKARAYRQIELYKAADRCWYGTSDPGRFTDRRNEVLWAKCFTVANAFRERAVVSPAEEKIGEQDLLSILQGEPRPCGPNIRRCYWDDFKFSGDYRFIVGISRLDEDN